MGLVHPHRRVHQPRELAVVCAGLESNRQAEPGGTRRLLWPRQLELRAAGLRRRRGMLGGRRVFGDRSPPRFFRVRLGLGAPPGAQPPRAVTLRAAEREFTLPSAPMLHQGSEERETPRELLEYALQI